MKRLDKKSQAARLLAAHRDPINRRISAARHAKPDLNMTGLSTWLTGPGAVLAEKTAHLFPAGQISERFALEFTDLALLITAHGFFRTAGKPDYEELWSAILPVAAELAPENPGPAWGMLLNALTNLERFDGLIAAQWVSLLARAASYASTPEELESIAVIAAWRAGMAHYRRGALTALPSLPVHLVPRILGADTDTEADPHTASYPHTTAANPHTAASELLARLETDPWFDPSTVKDDGFGIRHRPGGFTGFGGPFTRPPTVQSAPDGSSFIIRSGDAEFALFADAFGAVIVPGTVHESAASKTGSGRLSQPVLKNGILEYGGRKITVADRNSSALTGMAFTSTAAVIYSEDSFYLTVIELPRAVQP